jgi:O-antigen ligase
MILGGATLALVPAGRTRRRFQIVAIAAFALIPATFSRGGMIALAASAVVMLLRVLSRQALARAAVVSAVVACALFATAEIAPEEFHVFTARFSLTQRSDASVVSRRELQARGYSLATAHLALGVGPGVFEIKERAFLDPAQPLNQQTDVLDTYLQAALSGGLLAFIGFAGLLILPAIQLTRRRCPLGYILGGVAAGVATLDTLTLAPLWVGIGIAAALLSASCDQPAGHPA